MKTRLLSYGLLIIAVLTVMALSSFEINRLLPVRIQWLYGVVIILLLSGLFWLMTKVYYSYTNHKLLKSHTFSGFLAVITIIALIRVLDYASSTNRSTEVARFLKANESGLKQVVDNKCDIKRINEILSDLNVRLIKGENDSYHFELYSFLGYGYRILYTKDLKTKQPQSPGLSPTFEWHSIKENWYYYSYLD